MPCSFNYDKQNKITKYNLDTMRKFEDLKIAVAGTGYVGLSIATLLSQKYQVTAVDVIPEKVEKINNRNLLFRMITSRSILQKII